MKPQAQNAAEEREKCLLITTFFSTWNNTTYPLKKIHVLRWSNPLTSLFVQEQCKNTYGTRDFVPLVNKIPLLSLTSFSKLYNFKNHNFLIKQYPRFCMHAHCVLRVRITSVSTYAVKYMKLFEG